MSSENSTIDRFILLRSDPATRSLTKPRRLALGTRRKTGPVPSSPALRRAFALLERTSPSAGGWLAERLWFRLPARPAVAARDARTPSGGEAFEVGWDGGLLRGRVYGEWGNPTAYLVHGWGGWWQQLSAYVEPLVAAGLCVVAFDAPSHGDSEPGRFGPRSTTFVEMAHALAAVVAEFGRPTVVVAHSAGALATLYSRRLGVSPDAYVLLAPPQAVDPMVQVFVEAVGLGERSRAAMVGRAERRVGLPMRALNLLELVADEASLPPLLVVHDRDDHEAPVGGGIGLANAWHDARLMVTSGLGHRRVMWDNAVVTRVSEFSGVAAEGVRRSSR